MPRDYLAELRSRVLVFDGSMGANLQQLHLTTRDFGGAPYEGCMDVLCVSCPDAPRQLHRGFL
ncbi:MAG TPA: homocysteine S-methyltransferase family protein, partial [Chloroflexota bacterium]|nr:homocysteine S-methyltransferase family protein [Chloroflexota bacterium]